MNKAIYTVITGNYDTVKEIQCDTTGWDCILFTDNQEIKSKTWKVIYIEKSEKPLMKQREIKMLSHVFLPDYALTLYIDGSMTLVLNPDSLIRDFYKGGFLTVKHPSRSTITAEAQAIINLKKDNADAIKKHLKNLNAKTRMPNNYALFESGFIIRDKSESSARISERWWQLFNDGVKRDQLSLPYASFMEKIKITVISAQTRNRYISIKKHDGSKLSLNIYYSNPYSVEKNIGKAINDFCQIVPNDDDWIVVQDGDILYLTPDWGKRIHDALKVDGDRFGLVSCYTNRLSSGHQLHGGKRSDNHDIRHHYEIAMSYTREGIEEIKRFNNIAGFFMAFKKSTWRKVGGFRENDIAFDTTFCTAVKAKGYKIGLIRSLYVYHAYRIWNEDGKPQRDKAHLK
jgi:cellulose synthase/poly-beta-1,6-N-acetylglucosamine synthase-like glycosyltransferase